MKKLLSLLLALLLLTPAAFAENAVTDIHDQLTWPLDFGDFVMLVNPADGLQSGAKAAGQTWAMLYPDYDPEALFHNTVNVVWQADNLNLIVKLMGAEVYANAVIASLPDQLLASGVNGSNSRLISAQLQEDVLTFSYAMDMDYSPSGLDLQLTLWYTQRVYLRGSAGTYIFTVTAVSEERMNSLCAYLDGITFAE